MRKRWRIVACAVGVASLSAGVGYTAPPLTGKDAFIQRQDTMKRMGRAFYLGIGRVLKGTAELGPDTVAAAEAVASLSGTLGSLFPPGSDVAESRMKAEIFNAQKDVERLITELQGATGRLVPAVKTADKGAIAAAYKSVNDACESCHTQFRKSE
jgi:cytochrome c556